MNKIVILDAATVSDNHAIWDDLKQYGNVEIYDSTLPDQVAARCSDAWAILTNKVAVTASTLEQCRLLRYIGVLATGYNIIDMEAAADNGVTVTNIPGYSTDSVAQLVFALLLELTNHTSSYSSAVAGGEWQRSPLFSFRLAPVIELAGLTMGVYGFGTIGQRVAAIAAAFGMKVITPSRKPLPDGVERVALPEFWNRADVVSINAAFTSDQKHLINEAVLKQMKPSAYLINTARGGFIDENALAAALNQGAIAGAGIDVLNQEPPHNGSPLIGARNCVVTPHVGWQSTEALKRLVDIAVGNVAAFSAGEVRNAVG